MSMQIGIVGKPNVGKSTFFNAATDAHAEIANYPFTTIDANRGVMYARKPCPCKDFNVNVHLIIQNASMEHVLYLSKLLT